MAILFLSQCDSSDRKNIPDVSNIKVNVQLRRFDQDLFALDTTNLEKSADQLALQYPIMLPLFANSIIHDQTNPLETPIQALRGFLKAPQIRNLYDSVQKSYPDLRWLDKDLKRLFQFHKYYFPNKPTPEVLTFISEFSRAAITVGDSICGIGLDMFLGENFSGYNPEVFPSYIRRRMKPEYILVELAAVLAQNEIEQRPDNRRLLDIMLYNGKILYLTDCLIPETADSIIMGYTRDQMEGCYANERRVWARILDQNLLFSTDEVKYRKLVAPSPNAPVAFQEAPGEIGNWLGWQIIKAYMKRFPNTTIQELLNFKDAQKFLELAKYKPRRE